jgi:secondary thiamine-phosphate synthase enzyme
MLNITDKVQNVLTDTGAREGFVTLFVQSSTSAISIMEFEEGLLTDIPNSLEMIAPRKGSYEHEKAYGDGNGHSHVRSYLVGVSLLVPFFGGKLLLGTWQQIVLSEFDVRPRRRSIIVQVATG